MIYLVRIRFLVLLLLFSLVSTACNAPLPILSNPEGGSDAGDGMFEPIDLSDGAKQDDGAQGQQSTSDEAGEDDGSMANFRCPTSPEPYALWFDHSVKYDTPGFGTWDIATSGMILLSVAEGLSEGTVQMPFQPGQVLVQGTVSGNFGRGDDTCNFQAPMEVIVNVDGNCDRGVVHLNILENWGEVDTTITCCSGPDDCDTGPFQWMLPVVQYQDVQFTPGNGYQVKKPFAGGSGALQWSLAVPVEPVPLTD